mmetsp:Transcript_19343/g.74186  ORF Transcript_19343/g.74186 Transcript_19343/m.74186 type:complete len:259 (+) Transcript_19343:1589-2365(+)
MQRVPRLPERLGECQGRRTSSSDGLRPPVCERLGHCGFVGAGQLAVDRKVRQLNCELHKPVWGAAAACDAILAEPAELQRGNCDARHDVRNPRLCGPDGGAKARVQGPVEAPGGAADVFGLRHVRQHPGQRGVDRSCKGHERFGDDVRGEPEDGVAVEMAVLEVDPGGAPGRHDHARGLVVPAVHAGPCLRAGSVDSGGAVQAGGGLLRDGRRVVFVEADEEDGALDGLERGLVARGHQPLSATGPRSAIFAREHADG